MIHAGLRNHHFWSYFPWEMPLAPFAQKVVPFCIMPIAEHVTHMRFTSSSKRGMLHAGLGQSRVLFLDLNPVKKGFLSFNTSEGLLGHDAAFFVVMTLVRDLGSIVKNRLSIRIEGGE